MKRIITLLCGVVVLSMLASCGGSSPGVVEPPPTAGKSLKPSEYSDADFDTSGDVVVKTEYDVYGADAPEVAYTITNNTETEYTYGVAYSVEIKMSGRWFQVPFPDNTAWIDIGIILKPHETNAASFSFSQLDYTFTDGTYRLIKEIGGKRYFAEFQVGKSPITAETPYGYEALERLPKEYSSEAAAANGDVVLGLKDTRNAEKLADFVKKTSHGMAAMVRVVMYTDEGDPIISDFIYNKDYYLYRFDNSRDAFGGADKGITDTIYSYLITNGAQLYLSNCAGWDQTGTYGGGTSLLQFPAPKSGDSDVLVKTVQEMTDKRLSGSGIRYKAYSPSGKKAVELSDQTGANGAALSYGYEQPGRGDTLSFLDPNGIAVTIRDVVWLSEDSYVLTCGTSGNMTYFKVVGGDESRSGYGYGYTVTDGKLEITAGTGSP